MSAPWMKRVERAMRRVMPADGSWHKVNTALDVHTGDGRGRLTLTCRGQREFVELSADELAEMQALLLSASKGYGL